MSRRSRGTGQVRIEDVAREAGVSAQSVSRYLRDPGRVGPATSARICEAISAVGYVPNLIAGSLASNRSHVVGILLPTLAIPAHAGPVEGLAAALRDSAYEVLVGTTGYDAGAEERLVRAFVGRRVDGLVLTSDVLSAELRRTLTAFAAPVVQIWELPSEPFDMAVGVSNKAVGAAVAGHFLARGHRLCAAVGHAQATDTRSAARVAGFVETLAAAGAPAPIRLDVRMPEALAQADAILARLCAQGPPSAVFCTAGQLTVALHFAARRAGLNLPDDLALMGLDSEFAALVDPPLSVVRVRTYEFGRLAGEMLIERLAGRRPETQMRDVGFEMILRAST